MKDTNYKRWFIQGTIGILLVGAGICMIVEAGFYKHTHPDTWKWISAGVGSLVVFMAGMVLFVDSLKYKIYYNLKNPV